eukprot:GSChrysophyteH1.ASY1.ANO1.1180.1 assembled CDS
MDQVDSTYLEEFISSVQLLPNNTRRDFELMRDLDREATELQKNLRELETSYLEHARQRKAENKVILVPVVDAVLDVHEARIRARLSRKTSIVINLTATIKQIQTKLNSDLAFFETTLRSCGDFEKASGAMPGTDVAIRPSQSSDEMILGKVIVYYADIGAYDVADIENSKRYHLSEELVTVLDLRDITNKRLSKGEVVYAVYPETTAFYLASVAQAPRRAPAGVEPVAQVQFQGDSENDVTPVRTVPLKHLFRAFT